MRLFVGCLPVQNGTTLQNEIFAGWFDSENEALGAWLKVALAKYPSGQVLKASASDITDLAANTPPPRGL